MFLFPLILVLVLVFIPDIYIYLNFISGLALVWKILWWLPLICILGTFLCEMLGIGYEFPLRAFFLLLTCVVLPKFLFFLISFIGKLIGYGWHPAYTGGNWLALGFGLLTFGCCLYGALYGWKKLEVHSQELTFQNLPAAFDGYKLVQITDLHVGTYGQDSAYFQHMVEQVNAQNPDLIVFTGDIVNSDPKELDPFMHVFGQLKAKDGVLSIIGNHDYCEYNRDTTQMSQGRMFEDVIKREQSFGWRVLRNENQMIHRGNDSIAIVGVEDIGKPPFPSRGDLKLARQGVDPETFQILLSHDPSHWRMETLPDTNIPLQLSGHTHAMQFKIFGWSPSSITYREWGGLYQEDGQLLYISTGAGGNVPFRFGAWPEVVVITLRK